MKPVPEQYHQYQNKMPRSQLNIFNFRILCFYIYLQYYVCIYVIYVEFICTFHYSKELENAAFGHHLIYMCSNHHATFCPNESQILSKSPGNPFAIQANWQNMSKEVEKRRRRVQLVIAFSIFHPIRKMKKSVGGICYLIFRHICSNISEQKSITLHIRGV